MKKVYILAALLMATTSAHAANAVSADTQGKRIEIELAAAGDSAPAPDAMRFNGEDDAEPGRPGFHEGARFYDDDRAPGPGRPDFESGRRVYYPDRVSGPGRPDFERGRRVYYPDRVSGPGRPGFDGGRRFNDDDRASGPGRPDFNGGRRFNDDDRAGPGRPGFELSLIHI